MVFAYPSNHSVSTSKRVSMTAKTSPEVKARREFIRSHDFYSVPDGNGGSKIKAVPKNAYGQS